MGMSQRNGPNRGTRTGLAPVLPGGDDGGFFGAEVVEEDEDVVFGGSWFGVVGDQVLSGGAGELHPLIAEGDVSDVGVVEGLAAAGVPANVAAFPQPRMLER